MKVGDKVWIFDHNYRVYPKDKLIGSAPIYSEHFRQKTIESETSRSWIVDGIKYSKKDVLGLYTDEQKEDVIWENENRYKIVHEVEKCSVYILRKINILLNLA